MFSRIARSSTQLSAKKRRSRRLQNTRHIMETLEARQLMSASAPAVQTYYLPVPAASVYSALKTIHSGPQPTVSTYSSISVAKDGTVVYYDQWENGFAGQIDNPTPAEIYNAVTNPAGVQIWGDGDAGNGAAPGYADDVFHAGDVIVLQSPSITIPRNPAEIYFDGGDKIAASKSVAVGTLNYAAGTATMLAGALQVSPTNMWGTSYKVPVGQNTANAAGMFNYTGLAIMAEKDGTVVKIDTNGDGTVDKTVTLDEGGSYLVNNGVKQGATVESTDASKPIQVNVITGSPAQTYASRWFTLTPEAQWSNSYYTAVSTRGSNATTVFLYNPSATPINVTQTIRGSGGDAASLTMTTVKVPARGSVKVTIPEGSGAHFSSAEGQAFYAVSTTDTGNSDYDWGMSLIPESQLTTQALVGLGFGRDPISDRRLEENSSPVWITTVGNGDAGARVFIDFNGDNAGPLLDPNGFGYDIELSLKELQSAKVYDPDGDQTAMLVYTLDAGVKLAVSWGEDPSRASALSPGIDAGTNIAPLSEMDAGKTGRLIVDANKDGVVSAGDTLEYTIVVNNVSRSTIGDIKVQDVLPAAVSYVPGTLAYTLTEFDGTVTGPITIPSDATFVLGGSGYTMPALAGGASFTITFRARIADSLALGLENIVNTGTVTSASLKEIIPLRAETPVFYDIGGVVFEDSNRNGAREAGEAGLGNVAVNLMKGSTIVASAVTDGAGRYFFVAPSLGNYTVDVVDATVQLALPSSDQTAGVDPSAVNLVGGGWLTDAGIDGYMTRISAIPSLISGHVTVGGAGLGGVSLTLTGTNAAGPIAPRTVVTGPDGSYAFLGVMTGTYTITEAQPAGLLDGADSAGNFGGNVAGIGGDAISNIELPGAAVGINYDFTEIRPASLAGAVFSDANNDGTKDAGEVSLGGVTLTLTGTSDIGAVGPITTVSGADGSYSFGTLRPGTYKITETQPAGYLDGKETVGSLGGTAGNDAISGIVVNAGAAGVAYNFAELAPATVSGVVFADLNNNGVKDAGENGIGGVKLALSGSNDRGTISAVTVTTAADGSYSFGNLRPGTYTVTETQAAGYLDGKDAKGGVVLAGSATTDAVSGINMAVGGSGVVTFGELPPSTVRGIVFADANNNGVKDDGEAVIAGVAVTLTGSNDLGAISPMTVMTAADGSYVFGTLRPGTYAISEAQPAGYLDGLDALEGAVIAGSDAVVMPANGGAVDVTDGIGSVQVSAGKTINATFGEVVPASVSGYVYVDANNNGVKDSGESGIGGVTVTLKGVNDQGVIVTQTATSGTDGSYSFKSLRAGTYSVTETQPAGYLDGLDSRNGAVVGGSQASDVVGNVVISQNGSAVVSFGELRPSSIRGYVYLDGNSNGQMDAGEPGLGGVKITLTGSNDAGAVASVTVTTAADGSYVFGTLRPGTYAVSIAQPAGYTAGGLSLGTAGGVIAGGGFTQVVLSENRAGSNYNFAELMSVSNPPTCTPKLTCGMTATIGYWQNKNGQALIKSLNGSSTSTALGNWMAATLPNMFGANAGSMNLAGKTNAQIAAIYVQKFNLTGMKLDAQVMAVAFAVYSTSSKLAGNVAAAYGFKVSTDGTGAATINVGSNGAAFGVPNNTTMSVLNILKATNAQAVNGNLYNGNTSLRTKANTVYNAINTNGDI